MGERLPSQPNKSGTSKELSALSEEINVPSFQSAPSSLQDRDEERGFDAFKVPDDEFLEHFKQYKNSPKAFDQLMGIVQKEGLQDPRLISLFPMYKDKPWGPLFFRFAAQKNPVWALQCIHLYKDEPWRADLLEKISLKEPRLAIAILPWEKEFTESESIQRKCIAPVLEAVIKEKYSDESWSQEVLQALESEDFEAEALRVFLMQEVSHDPMYMANVAVVYPEVSWKNDFLSHIAINGGLIAHGNLPFQPSILLKSMKERAQHWEKRLAQGKNKKIYRWLDSPLLGDPALDLLRIEKLEKMVSLKDLLEKVSIPVPLKELLLPDLPAIILRELFFREKSITKENVVQALENIIQGIEDWGDVSIFQERNVVLLSHNEVLEEDAYRFGRASVQKQLEEKSSSFHAYRAKDEASEKELKTKKQEVLDQIRETPPPFTFFFDGHGGPDALFLKSGKVEDLEADSLKKELYISPEELAQVLIKRVEKYGEALQKTPDILIFGSCFSHTFLRNMYDQFPESTAKPIAIGGSEYNKLGYGNPDAEEGCMFFKMILKSKNIKSFMYLIQREKDQLDSNPSLYVPTKDPTKIRQITQQDKQDELEVS